jgi:hypothetical protein
MLQDLVTLQLVTAPESRIECREPIDVPRP